MATCRITFHCTISNYIRLAKIKTIISKLFNLKPPLKFWVITNTTKCVELFSLYMDIFLCSRATDYDKILSIGLKLCTGATSKKMDTELVNEFWRRSDSLTTALSNGITVIGHAGRLYVRRYDLIFFW
jgi:hypothetical protein